MMNNDLSLEEYKEYLKSFDDEDMYKLHYHLGLQHLFLYPYRKFENEFLSIFRDKLKLDEDKYKIMNDMDNSVKATRPIILGGSKWFK